MKWLKKHVRSQIREKRLHLPPSLQLYFSNQIARQLLKMDYFQKAHSIALYYAILGEVSTEFILHHALLKHKACYLPVLKKDHLEFMRVTPATNFKKNRFGIFEPVFDKSQTIHPATLDLALVPLVAFDAKCHRLGMGGGYYDRTFHFKHKHNNKPKLVGLAYDFQHVRQVPRTHSDVLLDEVITEKKRYMALKSTT